MTGRSLPRSVRVGLFADCGASEFPHNQSGSTGVFMNDQTTAPSGTVLPTAPNRVSPVKLIKWAVAALILIAGIAVAVHYWRLSRLYVSTDNAYVNANRIEIAAQVSGPVRSIWIRDQQPVKLGELLFQIDPEPYQLAVDAAQAQLELANQSNSQDRAAVAAARAQGVQRTAG